MLINLFLVPLFLWIQEPTLLAVTVHFVYMAKRVICPTNYTEFAACCLTIIQDHAHWYVKMYDRTYYVFVIIISLKAK